MTEMNSHMLSQCPHTACGACSMTALAYKIQLEQKHRALISLLGAYGEVLPPLGMTSPYHYRNKVTRTFAAGHENGRQTLLCGT